MGKSYVDIVKYEVRAKFDVSGLVDKTDIIGAIFGQTEGLLGSGLDLRELQKNGKIGRIEIDTTTNNNRVSGTLHLPSSLGRIDTCILAAAIESVDRVGPFETAFKIEKVEDTRTEKRKKVINRAKELVKVLLSTEIPDSREISEQVASDVKASVITLYGEDKLPAGPDIDTSEDVIFVEGRADVVNLLKSDITNCAAIGGASGGVPKTVIDIARKKEVTVFLDGDRGGDIILKTLMNMIDIDFVARAPDGKEVEELTTKEMIKALRSRTPIEQIFPNAKKGEHRAHAEGHEEREHEAPHARPAFQQQQQHRTEQPPVEERPQQRHVQAQMQQPQQMQQAQPQQQERQQQRQQQQQAPIMSPSEISARLNRHMDDEVKTSQASRPKEGRMVPGMLGEVVQERERERGPQIQEIAFAGVQHREQERREPQQQGPSAAAVPNAKYLTALSELQNTLRSRLYDGNGNAMNEVPIRELIQTIKDAKGVSAVVFDGIITSRLVELAMEAGVKEVYGIRASPMSKHYQGILLYTKEKGSL